MTHSTDLLALEKRLVEAGEGSRLLDGHIWIMEHGVPWAYGDELPYYTTSLDAAIALAERKLAECGKSCADILNWILEAMEDVGDGDIVSAFARAVCINLVRALAHNPAVEK